VRKASGSISSRVNRAANWLIRLSRDAISLTAYLVGCDQLYAARRLATMLGLATQG
jgi:hypothetical protein